MEENKNIAGNKAKSTFFIVKKFGELQTYSTDHPIKRFDLQKRFMS